MTEADALRQIAADLTPIQCMICKGDGKVLRPSFRNSGQGRLTVRSCPACHGSKVLAPILTLDQFRQHADTLTLLAEAYGQGR